MVFQRLDSAAESNGYRRQRAPKVAEGVLADGDDCGRERVCLADATENSLGHASAHPHSCDDSGSWPSRNRLDSIPRCAWFVLSICFCNILPADDLSAVCARIYVLGVPARLSGFRLQVRCQLSGV